MTHLIGLGEGGMGTALPPLNLTPFLSAIKQMGSRWRSRLTAGFSAAWTTPFMGVRVGRKVRCGRGLSLLFSKFHSRKKCPEGPQSHNR